MGFIDTFNSQVLLFLKYKKPTRRRRIQMLKRKYISMQIGEEREESTGLNSYIWLSKLRHFLIRGGSSFSNLFSVHDLN